MVNSFLAESVGSDGYAIKGPAAAALQAGAALIALAGDQIGFTTRPVMQMPAATPTPGQVLAWNGSSWEPSSISAGTPGGTSGQLQFNNGGVFDGVSGSYVSGSDVTLAGNFSLAANKQIEFGSVGIIKQSANVLYLQSASGATFRDMAGTGYVSATAQSFYGADYVQGVQRVLVGGSSGGRLLPITDGVAVYNWAQSALGNVQASKYKATGGLNGVGYENEFTGYGTGWNNNGETVVVVNSSVKVLLGNTVIHGGSYGLTGTMGYNPTADVIYGRNATGPAAQIQAAGGLKVTNFAGSADGPLTALSAALSGGTVTASTPALTVSQTWNNAAVAFTGILANFTSTAALSSSKLMDLQIGGVSVLNVGPNASINLPYSYAGLIDSSNNGGGTNYTWGGPRLGSTASIQWSAGGGPNGPYDTQIVRATGPMVQIKSDGGFNSMNLAASAGANVYVGGTTGSANIQSGYLGFGIAARSAQVSGAAFVVDASDNAYISFGNGGGKNLFIGAVGGRGLQLNAAGLYTRNASTTQTNLLKEGGGAELYPQATTDKGLLIKSVASYAANFIELQDSTSAVKAKIDQLGSFTGANATFKHTTSANPGGIVIRDYQTSNGGYSNLEIAGSNWSLGTGIQLINHSPSVVCSAPLQCTSSFGTVTLYAGVTGNPGAVENGVRLTADTTNAYIFTIKYASSPYPPLIVSGTGIKLNTGNGAWASQAGWGTTALELKTDQTAVFSGHVTSPFQTLSADPTTTDISAGNQRMVKNSTSGTLKLWANDAGTMKSVALT